MERIVYLYLGERGEPYSPNALNAARGFEHFGYTVRWFSRHELPLLVLSPETPVVGGVGIVRAALERLGVRPAHETLPLCLRPLARRRVWESSVADVRRAGIYPVFVKPREDLKTFTGCVVDSEDAFDALTASRPERAALADDLPLLCQEPVRFTSEWRTFVVRRRVVGTSHYAGDPLRFPDPSVIREALAAYVDAPAGYSADFGVLETGETALVEVNEGYSLGSGGLLGSLYAELLRARWEELTGAGRQS